MPTKSIKEWPKSERPRERLLSQGAGALSDAELPAVILRNGVAGKDATSPARELLAQFGGMRALLSADQSELQKVKGLGQAKVTALIAITEMAKRCLRQDLMGASILRDPSAAVDEIEREIRQEFEKEVSSVEVGERIMRRLQKLDEVAYVRFASVYRSFKDINQFMSELRDLLNQKQK